jgi:hypothetical protein
VATAAGVAARAAERDVVAVVLVVVVLVVVLRRAVVVVVDDAVVAGAETGEATMSGAAEAACVDDGPVPPAMRPVITRTARPLDAPVTCRARRAGCGRFRRGTGDPPAVEGLASIRFSLRGFAHIGDPVKEMIGPDPQSSLGRGWVLLRHCRNGG